jgi:hypothetical protein
VHILTQNLVVVAPETGAASMQGNVTRKNNQAQDPTRRTVNRLVAVVFEDSPRVRYVEQIREQAAKAMLERKMELLSVRQ